MEIQSFHGGVAASQNTGMKSAYSLDRSSSLMAEERSSTPKVSDMQDMQEEIKKIADKSETEELKKELAKLVEELNKETNPLNLNIKFKFEDEIEQLTVSVYEKDSDRLIKKIPSDEAIALMKKMKEIIGMLLDKKA